jgi:Fe-S oxidoreductase
MLGRAKWRLEQIMRALGPAFDAGVPIVGVEPSCVAVFRDELRGLFPDSPRAIALSRLVLGLDAFLNRAGVKPVRLDRRAVVHGHCHQKALSGMTDTEQLLQRAGMEAHVVDSGCCGLAGGFGYERGHYDVSMAAGEHALLPRVREAPLDALVIADGFSCRSQIRHATKREALHLAQVLQLALHQGPRGPRGLPERGWAHVELPKTRRRKGVHALAWLAAIGALGFGLIRMLPRRGSSLAA